MQDLVYLACSQNLYTMLTIYTLSANCDYLFRLISYMTSVLGLGNITESEKLNLEAITKIHFHLDDDRNGKVDLSESNEVSAQNKKGKASAMGLAHGVKSTTKFLTRVIISDSNLLFRKGKK